MFSKFKNDAFLKNYAVFFSGSMIVAALNYAFHPVLARLLDPAAFGDVQALMSLMTMAGVLLGAFSMVAINITSNIQDPQRRDPILAELRKISFMLIGVAVLALFVGFEEVESFFNFTTMYPLVGLAIILPVSALITFRNAYLHGSGRFAEVSTSSATVAFSRLVFATALTLLGLSVLGVTVGIILSIIVGYLYVLSRTRKELNLHASANLETLEEGTVRKELTYGLLVLVATSFVTFLYSVDVLAAKHYLSPEEAGLYSGISVVGKILYFAIAPVAGVLLYSIKLRNTKEENAAILKKSLLLAGVVGGAGLLTFYLFGGIIIKLLIGSKYIGLSGILAKVGLVMFLAAVVNILMSYFLALRRFFLAIVALGGIICAGALLSASHSTIDSMLTALVTVLTVTIGILCFAYAKDHFYNHSRI